MSRAPEPIAKRPMPLYLMGFIGYFVLISVGSSIPGKAIAELGFDVWDKLLHTAEYLPLGFLAAMALRRQPLGLSRKAVVTAGPLLVLALGVVDELHQWFVPGRFCSALDAVADALGGFIGVVAGIFFDRARTLKTIRH